MPHPSREPSKEATEQTKVALLLVDVINEFSFPEAPQLLQFALPAAKKIAALKKRLRARGVPAIYVNDNFGRWRSDFRSLVELCEEPGAPGREITKLLAPEEKDYFVLKPKHSGFYASSLDVLLASMGVCRLIITGFAADICVLFTANDAYMREFEVQVPADCVAAETDEAKRYACAQIKRFLKADVRPSRFVKV